MDKIQTHFLKCADVTEVDALCKFRVAPLLARRYMAMLAIIHRSIIGCGPPQFKEFFKLDLTFRNPTGRECERRHNRQLVTHRTGNFLEILANSILGLVDVYNLLPGHIVEMNTVSNLQKALQKHLIEMAKINQPGWQNTFSPRLAIYAHPLRKTMRSGNGYVNKICAATNMTNANITCIDGWLSLAR